MSHSSPRSLLEVSQANLSDKPLPNDFLVGATVPKLESEVEQEITLPCSCLFLFFNPHWRLIH